MNKMLTILSSSGVINPSLSTSNFWKAVCDLCSHFSELCSSIWWTCKVAATNSGKSMSPSVLTSICKANANYHWESQIKQWEVKSNKHSRLDAVQNEASLVGMICMKVAKEILGTWCNRCFKTKHFLHYHSSCYHLLLFIPLNMKYMTYTRGLMNRMVWAKIKDV